jgi:hypothetical protein
MCFVPAGARSIDASSWETIAKLLAAGKNPYHATSLLNWPPLWMQLVFCLAKVAAALGIPFFRALQVFLVLAESIVALLLLKLTHQMAPTAPARRIVIFGLALNPVAVLLVCQHCNFDVLVALWVILFLKSLLRYNLARNPVDWLSACLFLGLGVLTKTVPLVLVPLLAGGFRQATASLRSLGALLLLGPVTLGMSVIYVLAPSDVTSKVLFYRSQEGFFGIHGLMDLAGLEKYLSVQNVLFYLLLLGVLALSWNIFWRRHNIGDRETVLYTALLLAAIPTLGPGYATQYIYWFMPLLVLTFACYAGQWRVVLTVFGVISAATYLVEYAFFPEYGHSIFYLWPTSLSAGGMGDALMSLYYRLDSETGRTLLRLPIFLAYLMLLFFGGRTLLRDLPNLRRVLAALGLTLAAAGLVVGYLVGTNSENSNEADAPTLGMDHDSDKKWATGALNNLAWKLATSPDVTLRDGALAVKGAERACRETNYRVTTLVGTLAAAYAETGRFEEAVATGQKACSLASASGETNLLRINQDLVSLYQARRPYHEPPPAQGL